MNPYVNSIKNWPFTLLLATLLLLAASCHNAAVADRSAKQQHWYASNGKIKALATTAMVADLVEAIGGDSVDTLTLITGQLDPHSYQLVKGDDEKFSFAQLIFYNGLGLEHGPSLMAKLQAEQKAVALGDYISEHHPEKILYLNGSPDPHIWMDLALWSESIPYIVAALSQKDPAHADVYTANGNKVRRLLFASDSRVRQILGDIPPEKRYLVTSHDAFNYFARAYLTTDEERQQGLWQERFHAPEGLAPESQISATDIHNVIDYLIKHNLHVIFPESNVSKDSLKKVLDAGKSLGIDVEIATIPLYGDAIGPEGSGADSHPAMIEYNAKIIARFLNLSS